MKAMKRILSCLVLFAAVFLILCQTSELLTPKAVNRYYILEKYLEDNPEQNLHDVKVFGSCHAYTSFDPIYFEEKTGASAFVYANPNEIIPTTYLRMSEQFKIHTPKVALVDTWGINPYETYVDPEEIFNDCLDKNIERIPITVEKLELIRDYDVLNYVTANFPFTVYKDRLLNGTLNRMDLSYSFEAIEPYTLDYIYSEMTSRLSNNGFKANPSHKIEDYPQKQNYIEDGEYAEIEPDIVKYVQKIIDLCRENNVELIFYRAPYISAKNELRRLNHFRNICAENGVRFYDLEKELELDYSVDFFDDYHLSTTGADRATDFLIPHIMRSLEGS